LTSLKFFFL